MDQYTQMKKSGVNWILDIPDTWGVRVLFQLANQVRNKNKDLLEQNLLSLSYGKIKRKDINNPEGLLPESFDGYNIIEKDDIVLRLTDLQNDHTSLRVGQAKEKGIITSAYTTLRPSGLVNPQYLYYVLHAYDLIKGFYGMGAGVRQGLNFDEVKTIKVPFPSLEEQQDIVTYLDDQVFQIDSIIEEAKLSIEEYKRWKQSIIHEAVTKGIDKTVETRDSGISWIGRIPSHWTVRKIKNGFSIVSGATPKSDKPEYWDGDVAWITPADYKTDDKYVGAGRRNLSDEGYASCGTTIVPTGSVIFSKRAPVGTVAINQVPLCTNQGCLSCIPNISADSEYFYYAMSVFTEQFGLFSSGTTFKEISATAFANFSMVFPPVEEQKMIANHLSLKCSEIDSIRKEKQSLIDDMEKYKRSLIYEAVTGKRKVV